MATPPIDTATIIEGGRADAEADADGSSSGGDASDDACTSYRGQNLRELPSGLLSSSLPHLRLSVLDLSGNELGALPGLHALAPTLKVLRLSRNWFTCVPAEVASLELLEEIDLSRNFVRGGDDALQVATLKRLSRLRLLDLRYNRKCFKQSQADHLAQELPHVESVRITISFPAPEGSFVGASPCDRDATTLRAQLEPWSTLALRRRLLDDFQQPPTDPEEVGRAEVMRRLLECYEREGGAAGRRVVRVNGTPVDPEVLDELLAELRQWYAQRSRGARGNQQERPSISAGPSIHATRFRST